MLIATGHMVLKGSPYECLRDEHCCHSSRAPIRTCCTTQQIILDLQHPGEESALVHSEQQSLVAQEASLSCLVDAVPSIVQTPCSWRICDASAVDVAGITDGPAVGCLNN